MCIVWHRQVNRLGYGHSFMNRYARYMSCQVLSNSKIPSLSHKFLPDFVVDMS